MFRFADPDFLYLLGIVPLFALLYIYMVRRSQRRRRKLGDPVLIKQLVEGYSGKRLPAKFILLEAAIALMAIMLARPQFGLAETKDEAKGIEAVFVVDVSNSMLAQDVRPNRLERAKLLIANLIDNMKNDKIGLSVFAGEAYPQLPITNDYVSAKMFLDQITPGMVTLQGTNLAAAIELGKRSFTDKKDVGKALIIITDGENHEADATEAAQAAAKEGIRIFILGIGSADGSKILLPDGSTLTDIEGKEVVSRLNEKMCQEVAAAGNGCYLHMTGTDADRKLLQEQLQKLPKADNSSNYATYDEQFQAIALLALLLLFAELLMSETKGTWLKRIKLFGR